VRLVGVIREVFDTSYPLRFLCSKQ